MSEVVDLKQFIGGFLSEATELVLTANTNLLQLESSLAKGIANPRAVRELYRALHTIKGLAGMVEVNPIVELAHAMETILRVADRGAGQMSRSSVELCLQGVQAIEDRISAIAKHKEVPLAPPHLLQALAQLEPVAKKDSSGPEGLQLPVELLAKLSPAERQQLASGIAAGSPPFLISFVPSKERADQGLNITSLRERVAQVGEIVKVVPRSVKQSTAAPGGLTFDLLVLSDSPREKLLATTGLTHEEIREVSASGPQNAELPPAPLSDPLPDELGEDGDSITFVRVEVSRLDDALTKLSELIVSRFRLKREIAALSARGVDTRALQDVDVLYGLQLDEMRAAIMRTRMVPVAELLARVPLLVSGLRRDTGKLVRLQIDAQEDAELDKAVGDRIFPAIVHLIRNAIDHAIEPPEERVRTGKSKEGLVRIECNTHSSNQLELIVSDDGRGIDAEKVARRAGRETPQSPEALLELLTTPGFSTVDHATKTSGRGLGMDIVKRIVTRDLRGEFSLRTQVGQGSAFSLRLPLTLTIVDVFIVHCAGAVFVVPVSTVEEIIEIDPNKKRRGPLPSSARGLYLYERREEAVMLVELGIVLDLPPSDSASIKGLVLRRRNQVLIFALDRVLGQQEVVVRPIDDPLVQAPGIVGATDLGDGRPTLVLDLHGLFAGLSSVLSSAEVRT